MNFRRIVFGAVIVLVLTTAVSGFSQSQISSGNIKGTITDATGGVLPGVTVTATNLDTGVERSIVTDSMGNFRFFLLPPADYELKAQLPSFSLYTRRPVQVTVGETVLLDAQLEPAGLQQAVRHADHLARSARPRQRL